MVGLSEIEIDVDNTETAKELKGKETLKIKMF